jgi:hypothetical protein
MNINLALSDPFGNNRANANILHLLIIGNRFGVGVKMKPAASLSMEGHADRRQQPRAHAGGDQASKEKGQAGFNLGGG